MNRKGMNYIVTTLGFTMAASGLLLVKIISAPQGIMRTLPYIFIGLGCGVFGHGIGNIISQKALKNNPEIEKQIMIEKNDERNVAISNFAKAKAYDMMIFVFGALMLSYSLMRVDLTVILLFVFAYLFVISYGLYYRIKSEKKM